MYPLSWAVNWNKRRRHEDCPMTTKECIESRRDLRRLLNAAWFMGAMFASGILDSGNLHHGKTWPACG